MPSSDTCERTHESAAWADSFMTSPSWPVSVSVLLPFILVASMNRISPPVGVQDMPIATPGMLVRSSSSSCMYFGTPSSSPTSASVTSTRSVWPSTRRLAILRVTAAIARSRFRSPASRV